jgi:hypothetical protein
MNRGFIDPWARIPRFIGRLSTSASSHHDPSLAAFITNIVDSDFRYTQDCIISTSGYDFGKDSGGGAGTGEIQLNCSLAVLEWRVKWTNRRIAMSKAQKGNKEKKKPKADKNQPKTHVSAYKAAQDQGKPSFNPFARKTWG